MGKQHVDGIFNIPHSSSLGKYLGCSIFQGRPKLDIFQTLISKFDAKLSNWKANSLSKVERNVPIQLNLEALPAHTMQCF